MAYKMKRIERTLMIFFDWNCRWSKGVCLRIALIGKIFGWRERILGGSKNDIS